MKKGLLMVFFLLLTFLLVSCFDYIEKDIRFLSDDEIPRVVSKNFRLPEGRLGIITYTSSNNEVLEIRNHYDVFVFNANVDIDVTLEARVRDDFKTFTIKVLKEESEPTLKERVEIEIENLKNQIPTIIKRELELPRELNGVLFSYELENNRSNYSLIKKFDESLWLVPSILKISNKDSATIRVNISNDTEEYIPSYKLEVKYTYDNTNLLEQEKIFLSLFDDVKYLQGTATLYVSDNEKIDLNYENDNDNVHVTVRIDNKVEGFTLRDNIIYISKLKREYTYMVIVTVTINDIGYDFRIYLNTK